MWPGPEPPITGFHRVCHRVWFRWVFLRGFFSSLFVTAALRRNRRWTDASLSMVRSADDLSLSLSFSFCFSLFLLFEKKHAPPASKFVDAWPHSSRSSSCSESAARPSGGAVVLFGCRAAVTHLDGAPSNPIDCPIDSTVSNRFSTGSPRLYWVLLGFT